MRRTVAAVGRTLVTVGLLILLFVAYQLWGTGFFTARAQAQLEDEFAELKAGVATTAAPTDAPPTGGTATSGPTTTPGPAPSTTPATTTPPTGGPGAAPGFPPIAAGDPLGKIEIPKIGVDWVFVQGTARSDLKQGPGHYPATPLPGQEGNAAIAGHRTTYGAPFYRLDELQPGDEILTETLVGTYRYVVEQAIVVEPTRLEVVANTPGEYRLTLTTCNPKYSARERLVIQATLDEEVSDPPLATTVAPTGDGEPGEIPGDRDVALQEGLEGDPSSRTPALLWGIATIIAGLAWWWAFRHWRHPATWFLGVIPFAMVLFGFYVYLERSLPAGY